MLNKQNRRPRNVNEQMLKMRLLKRALMAIRNSGTVQEIRESIQKVDDCSQDGFYKTKRVRYWAFHAILGEDILFKIVAVVKKIGDGKIMFWSVLPHKDMSVLYTKEIIEEN